MYPDLQILQIIHNPASSHSGTHVWSIYLIIQIPPGEYVQITHISIPLRYTPSKYYRCCRSCKPTDKHVQIMQMIQTPSLSRWTDHTDHTDSTPLDHTDPADHTCVQIIQILQITHRYRPHRSSSHSGTNVLNIYLMQTPSRLYKI